VQVVRRADRHVVDRLVGALAAELRDVAIESLDLGEEGGLGEVRVNDADRVVRVDRRHQLVARVLDGAQVARRDIAGESCERKIHDLYEL